MESAITRCSCSYSKWFVKIGLRLIVVNGCMVCPTTVSFIILSSRSKISSSNFFFFNFRLSCFKMRVLNCCSKHKVMRYFLPFFAYIFPLTLAIQYNVSPALHLQQTLQWLTVAVHWPLRLQLHHSNRYSALQLTDLWKWMHNNGTHTICLLRLIFNGNGFKFL